MSKCKDCGKKLGIFEGYNDFSGEYCKKCYHTPTKMKQMEEREKKEKKKEKIREMKEKKKEIKENIKRKNENMKYPSWIWVLFWAVIALELLVNFFITFIHIALFFWFKSEFEKWAVEIKESPITPFIIVLFLGIFGQIGYYIYCKNKMT